MKLSQLDGSPPQAADVNRLVTLTVSSYVTRSEPTVQKLDLVVPQSGIIPFTLSLESATNSTRANLRVCRDSYQLVQHVFALMHLSDHLIFLTKNQSVI